MKYFNKILRSILFFIMSALVIIVFLVPFYWMILTAFKTVSEVFMSPPSFFVKDIQWHNFVQAFTKMDFFHYAKNSIIITLGTLTGQILVIIPASYVFARYNFKGKKIFFSLILATMMIPGQLIFLPVFVMYAKLGVLNTYGTLIIPFISNAMGIFMLRQTFMQVPDSLIEAARLDNAGEFKIIYTIMVPMAIPTLVTLALFTFISTWNNYFYPLVWTTTDAVRTLPVGIMRLKDDMGLNPQVIMAGNTALILPILIVFVFARKQIIKAFTYMGIK
ncbi:MAG: carbohydrate ABC transporter permease [Spirochaetales bacterium]|nr:carbohydrate ABC transporter permease [Spirochaetales bacterium]